MIHSCVFCLVIVVHESLVCPEQLNFLLFLLSQAQVTSTISQAQVKLNYVFDVTFASFETNLNLLKSAEVG